MGGMAALGDLDWGDLGVALASGLLLGYGGPLLSGFFPLGRAPLPMAGPRGYVMVVAGSGALAALAVLLLYLIVSSPAWAPALIIAGLALLAGPLVFQALPPQRTGGTLGLCAFLLAEAALLAALSGQLVD